MTQTLGPWQKQRLRLRLKAYKIESAKGWTAIAEAIILSKSNALDFPDETQEEERRKDEAHRKGTKRIRPDVHWSIQGQDLLRFADGEIDKKSGRRTYTNTSPDKLNHICAFLIEEGFLPRNFQDIDSWDTWDHNVLLSMSEMSSRQEPLYQGLSGEYEHRSGETLTVIDFAIPPDGTLAQVTHAVGLLPADQTTPAELQVRTGWAYLIGTASLLVITKLWESVDRTNRATETHCVYSYEIDTDHASRIAVGLLGSTADFGPARSIEEPVTPLILQRNSEHPWLAEVDRDDLTRNSWSRLNVHSLNRRLGRCQSTDTRPKRSSTSCGRPMS